MEIFISLFFFILYSAFILYYGKYGLSQSSQLRTFFVANNCLGLWPSIFTFCATWVSMTSLLAITASFYLEGLTPLYSVILGWMIGASLLLFAVKKLREYNVLTIPEFFRIRYNSKLLQVVAGVVNICIHLSYMVIQIYGFGLVLSYLLEIPYLLAISMVYLFLIYTTFGGMQSIARTDTINFVWIWMSILVLAGFLAWKIHEQSVWSVYFQGLLDFSNNSLSIEKIEPPSSIPIISFVTMSLVWILGKATHTQYLIRIVSAKDDSTAKRMIWISIIILSVLYLALAFIGTSSMYITQKYVSHNPNEIILLIIREIGSTFLGSFILMGFLASAISTANSQLLILTSSFSYDVLGTLFKKKIDERRLGMINRLIILCGATSALLLTTNPPSTLLTMGSYLWGILACSFFWPLYGGLLWKKATAEGAHASMVYGLISGVFFTCYHFYLNPTGQIHPAVYAIILSGVLFVGVSLYTFRNRKIDNERIQ